MTIEPTIMMFNKPTRVTYSQWRNSAAFYLLDQIPRNVVEYVYSINMTNMEKKAHPEYKTTGGYLKVLDESDVAQKWWDSLSDSDREIIYNIPNFDADIFKECTGIDVRK